MKANTEGPLGSHDFAALDGALQKIVTFAPHGYTNWASIARDGADGARAQDADAVKASCRSCHGQYRDRYKREMRDRPL